ncbi:hypothetical protein BDV29DRAFT_180703 [Aspergillus leporis]|uniref:Uncharacterized protein n=1 Tax=Aspergillus leporis TaxID=41062 RepID=A0A5N5WPX5_9EURO|nr:hypothetical protein BDV29DRAFT_180703 [Aspergillus leporis]
MSTSHYPTNQFTSTDFTESAGAILFRLTSPPNKSASSVTRPATRTSGCSPKVGGTATSRGKMQLGAKSWKKQVINVAFTL